MSQFDIIAKTYFGFEKILADEIHALGGTDIELLNRAVAFRGDKKLLYACNYHLRTALAVLVPIFEFEAENAEDLYAGARKLDWDMFFDYKNTFSIHTTIHSDNFNHSRFAALKVKDAVVDHFREKFNIRPSVDTERPDIKINLHIYKNSVTLLLDSSGDTLYKRGYRKRGADAHMSEVLAAGLLKLSGWKGEKPLLDPMCGSGTLLTEAAMLASNIPAGKFRTHYSFLKWKDFDASIWKNIQLAGEEAIENTEIEIVGFDTNEKNVKNARINADAFKNWVRIAIVKADFFKMKAPFTNGFLVLNPPYGERLEDDNIFQLYNEIGTTLKHQYTGYEAWIISSNKDALKKIGLRSSKKYTVFNGPLECKYQGFELYQGSKKMN